MKVYRNILDEKTLHLVLQEFEFKKDKAVWTGSSEMWPKNLTINTSSDCMVSPLAPHISTTVEKCLNDKIEIKYNKIGISMHVWRPGSSINMHDDGMYTFGATIYLNEEWSYSDGGLFLWKDKNESDPTKFNALLPSFNTLVLNDFKELHFTTPISSHSKRNKLSLQIFGRE